MAIKIIKEGNKKTFTAVCPECGCEFEYDTSDLDQDWSLNSYPSQYKRYVKCPCCHEKVYHDKFDQYPGGPNIFYTSNTPELKGNDFPIPAPNTFWNANKERSCEDCMWYEELMRNPDKAYTVGDTPCTFCSKMRPKCK